MRLLHAALSVVGAAPPKRPGRERLKSALAAQATAKQAVIEARATVERLEAVIKAADDAAHTATQAARAVTDARTAWVQGGCQYSVARELQVLEDTAAEAARAAGRAAANTKPVSPELRRAQSAIDDARNHVRDCEHAITSEIGLIIAQEESALFEQYAQAADELRTLRVKLMALHSVVDAWRPHGDSIAPSREGAAMVDASLERGRIANWEQERESARPRHWVDEPQSDPAMGVFEECTARWRDRAAALRADPEP